MKHIKISAAMAAIAATAFTANANLVAQFPLDVKGGQIVEKVSGHRFSVQGNFAPENLPGAVGKALRFDGYTSHIDAQIGDVIPSGTNKMTVSIWAAVPSYPIIEIDTNTSEMTPIVSCLNEGDKTGFGFFIGFDGKYAFRTFVNGWAVNITVDTPLTTYQWNNLTAVIDGEARTATLYNNGVAVGSARCNGAVSMKAAPLYMGQGTASRMSGPFELMSFNGLLDDISVWDEAIPEATIKSWKPENEANLDIPASRFADDILRPRFHGMPAAAWTNECHGMYYSGGRYHLFFQKNADGPFMARLHWGHISSENLYDWQEEKIAIAPGAPYDIKGCWSGCVFSDEVITGGRPNIIYTAVDYAKATIAQASPDDNSLLNWTKSSANPIINGRPGGLSDDFRDPYFFRSGDNAYIIVGSSKDNVGTTTLHRYDPVSKTWSNDGKLFFTGSSTTSAGRFWEMPVITRIEGTDKWLFCATPLETSVGVKTIYYTGSIASDGTFVPDAASSVPAQVELISRDGFGLLSPTVYNHDGKTIALGIVPDKLPSSENWHLGWAHCYSLPREWSIGDDGRLSQRPYEGLKGLRTATRHSLSAQQLDGAVAMGDVEGRQVEVCATFTVGNSPVGFNFFKNGSGAAKLRYIPTTGELEIDFSTVNRIVNDGGVYNGVYRGSLPKRINRGSEVKINMFIDHSIIDVFINDRYATSVRIFATDSDADAIEVASDGQSQLISAEGWILDPKNGDTGVEGIIADSVPFEGEPEYFDITGVRIPNPQQGNLYIVRRGTKVTKEIVR